MKKLLFLKEKGTDYNYNQNLSVGTGNYESCGITPRFEDCYREINADDDDRLGYFES
jgi:hypothetical protein